ncbi:MAG: XRE family transcriptional regulator [Runella slithyformis]|nr:MAG: XRE family transcriptional regulator [Runella slithyformis]
MSSGERLREVRGRLTLQEFADSIQAKVANISSIENNRSQMSVDLAIKICEVYECSMDWLIRGVGHRQNTPAQVQEPQAGYVLMPMQEVIDMQRKLIKQTEEERDAAQAAAQRLKNIEGVPLQP